jgi:hypothetical protein
VIEEAQSNLMTLAAGAVLSSCLLAVASMESAEGQDASVVSALDAIAFEVARAQCSASHPTTAISLAAVWKTLPERVVQVTLLPSHLRARMASGAALASVEFPALALESPLDLLGRATLTLAFDFLSERCAVSLS